MRVSSLGSLPLLSVSGGSDGGISFGRTTVCVSGRTASHLMVAGRCEHFSSGGFGKTLGARWAFGSHSPGRDQPGKTICQHLRPLWVLLCRVAWGEHGWRALARLFDRIVTSGVQPRGHLPRGSGVVSV